MEVVARELKAHLRRLAIWSGSSLAAGIILLFALRSSVGGMTAGWALVNLAIFAFSWKGKPPTSYQKFREFLAFNQGLNVMYIAVGLTLVLSTEYRDVWVTGMEIMPQGLALLVLDGILMRKTSPSQVGEPG